MWNQSKSRLWLVKQKSQSLTRAFLPAVKKSSTSKTPGLSSSAKWCKDLMLALAVVCFPCSGTQNSIPEALYHSVSIQLPILPGSWCAGSAFAVPGCWWMPTSVQEPGCAGSPPPGVGRRTCWLFPWLLPEVLAHKPEFNHASNSFPWIWPRLLGLVSP